MRILTGLFSGMAAPLTMVLAGCMATGDAAMQPVQPGGPLIARGGDWRIMRVAGQVPPAGAIPSFSVRAGQISGYTGCNRYFGSVQPVHGALRFGPLGVTKMACAPPIMKAEAAFLSAMARVDGADAQAGRLILTSKGQPLIDMVAMPATVPAVQR